MSSKMKMSWALHPTAGRVSVDDIQLDETLNESLKCEFCHVDLSFVGTYIKQDNYVAPILRLKKGRKNHLEYDGENVLIINLTTKLRHFVKAKWRVLSLIKKLLLG